MRTDGFYHRLPSGQIICRLCHGTDGAHTPECAVLVMHGQLRELTAQLGFFVVAMQETLEALEARIRGDVEQEEVSRGAH